MTENQQLIPTIYEGWHAHQETLIKAIAPLDPDQLGLRAALNLLSVGEIGVHIVQARAAWFYRLMGDGGDEFNEISRWNPHGEHSRSAQDIVAGLETTWRGMHDVIAGWTPEDWDKTWPDEDDASTPDVLTRQWVIWHILEHDLSHGGEISIILGANGLQGLKLSG
jgi:uncharacterized damage-inducible protein DinB